MKAIAVYPKRKDSLHMRDVKEPYPSSEEVLIRVLEVGVCGTDRGIVDGIYSGAPVGSDFLILGHENLGIVEKEGSGFKKGDLVVATVRRPCEENCIYCSRGESDMCLTGNYKERGIKGLHGYMTEYYAEKPMYLVKIPSELRDVAVLVEPLSIIEKAVEQALRIQRRLNWEPETALVLGAGPVGILATMVLRNMGLTVYAYARSPGGNLNSLIIEQCGAHYISASETTLSDVPSKAGRIDIIIEAAGDAKLFFEAICILGANGVLVLTGVAGGGRSIEIDADCIDLEMVMENKVIFGSVNANKRHFDLAVKHFKDFQERWPGLLNRMITRRVLMEDFSSAIRKEEVDIKVVMEVSR